MTQAAQQRDAITQLELDRRRLELEAQQEAYESIVHDIGKVQTLLSPTVSPGLETSSQSLSGYSPTLSSPQPGSCCKLRPSDSA